MERRKRESRQESEIRPGEDGQQAETGTKGPGGRGKEEGRERALIRKGEERGRGELNCQTLQICSMGATHLQVRHKVSPVSVLVEAKPLLTLY